MRHHISTLVSVCLLLLAGGVPGSAQYAAWWHLDENGGQIAADASGNGNTDCTGRDL